MTALDELEREHFEAGLAYHVAGSGPTVVLVHGWGNSWFIWRDTILALAQAGYRVYTPDLPGCGHSAKPVCWYTPSDYLSYLERWLAALAIDDFVLVGHSLGGHLSLSYTLRHPSQVRKLVVVDPAFGASGQLVVTAAELFLTVAAIPLVGELALTFTPYRLLRWALSRPNGGLYGPDRLATGVLERMVVDYLGNSSPLVCNSIRYLVLFSLPGLRSLRPDADLRPRLGEITAPTLVVWGRHDALIRPGSLQALAAALPHGIPCPIEEAGHSPQIEAPADFQTALLGFLANP